MQHPLAIPLLFDLKNKETSASTLLAAHLLLETGRSFLYESEKLWKTPPNCRIILLRRANEVRSAMAHLTHKYGPQVAYQEPNASLLEILKLILTRFLSDNTFDLYSQSPWVAGSYMSAISEHSLLVGLEALNEGDAFGAVIHLYNMLQQIDIGCPQIPILEQLRTLFTPVVFADKEEPRKSFANILQLFCGGAKIYKDQSVTIIGQDQRKGTRCVGSKDRKISLAKMTPCAHHESLSRLYLFSEEFWVHITGNPKFKRQYMSGQSSEHLWANHPPSALLHRSQEVIRSEYEGTFPLARVNCFAVLRLCQEILLAIATEFKQLRSASWPPGMDPAIASKFASIPIVDVPHGLKCVLMSMRLVDGAVSAHEQTSRGGSVGCNRKWKDTVGKLPPIGILRDTVVAACKGRNLEDFLWKNV